MIPVLHLSGSPGSTGRQHGEQAARYRPQILASMQARLSTLRQAGQDLSPYVGAIESLWQIHAPGTLEMLVEMAKALDLDWQDFFTYTIASYLTDRLRLRQTADGCTTWAASGDMTRDEAPILAKNRDYRFDHQPLQCLARVSPAQGNPYLCLTSMGSPGVFSSGINAAGLAVADTHVTSTDTGPGIARYSLMMDVLEQFSRVQEAVSYLSTKPHFGDGTVILADTSGDMAVFEIAHSVQAVRFPQEGFIVSTNHFSMPETQARWEEDENRLLQGNTLGRRARVEESLRSARGQVDVAWGKALMRSHGGRRAAICRHFKSDEGQGSISSVIYLPRQAGAYVANGRPCRTRFKFFQVNNGD